MAAAAAPTPKMAHVKEETVRGADSRVQCARRAATRTSGWRVVCARGYTRTARAAVHARTLGARTGHVHDGMCAVLSRVGLQVSKAVKAVLAHMKREAAIAPPVGAFMSRVCERARVRACRRVCVCV
ncbi:hypothetical protein EON68_03350 [archaeon]|nr:MAG: hypothetical protein EON68_03350 [archaeon]